jgi:ParB-like chromosome segregation protein Spo0J
MTAEPVIPLSVLGLDLPEPAVEATALEHRGIEVLRDDLGRAAISRVAARMLLTEHREQQEAVARRREEIERRVIAADEARRAALPRGIPVSAEVPGLTPAMLMMAADPLGQSQRRESVLEHALQHRDGAVYHPIQQEQADQ